jgi:hypothetical protein
VLRSSVYFGGLRLLVESGFGFGFGFGSGCEVGFPAQ